MWGLGPWGVPVWGGWWIFPLVGLLFMAVMAVFCARMMRGMMAGGGMCGHGGRHESEPDDVRQEVHELREEIRHLRASN
ncbi:MAG: hypothetical protein HY359_12850 [Candidatus Rokubacteria bacterium]|nr:hypothetical protein [Candidatus Rokubacteria bacterium]